MDQSLHDEINRLKAIVEAQAETVVRQETLINQQLSALEEMVRLRETVDDQERRIRELRKAMKPWNIWKWWCRRLFGKNRDSGD